MKKKLCMLTKSDKNSNFCIAGIDLCTKKWIRLQNKAIRAMSERDLTCDDGRFCGILDVIEVDILEENDQAFEYFQPENVFVDVSKEIQRKGSLEWRDVFRLRPPEIEENILGIGNPYVRSENNNDRLADSEINLSKPKSLQIVKAENLRLLPAETRSYGVFKHRKAEFDYINNRGLKIHYKLYVTDPDYNVRSVSENTEQVFDDQESDTYLILSLGEKWKDENHYLLIAKIITIPIKFYYTTKPSYDTWFYHRSADCGFIQGATSVRLLRMQDLRSAERIIKCNCWKTVSVNHKNKKILYSKNILPYSEVINPSASIEQRSGNIVTKRIQLTGDAGAIERYLADASRSGIDVKELV